MHQSSVVADPQVEASGSGAKPFPQAGTESPSQEHATALMVEMIAEAVVRKIDEREKINLLAEAVIARLQELGQNGGTPDQASS